MRRLVNELLQTQINDPDIARYGCWFMCLLWVVWVIRGRAATQDEVLEVYEKALREGAVETNEIPIGTSGWHRCFVWDAQKVLDLAHEVLGVWGRTRYLGKADIANSGEWLWQNPIHAPTQYTPTAFVASVPGHFRGLGPNAYNPDPRLDGHIKNIRVFSTEDYSNLVAGTRGTRGTKLTT